MFVSVILSFGILLDNEHWSKISSLQHPPACCSGAEGRGGDAVSSHPVPLVGRAMKKVQTGICTNGFIQNLQLLTWHSISTDTFLLVDDFSFYCLSSRLHSTIFSALKWGKETVYQIFWWLPKLIFHLVHVKVLAWFWFIHLIQSLFKVQVVDRYWWSSTPLFCPNTT